MATKGKSKERLSLKGATHKAYKVLCKTMDPKFVSSDRMIPIKILKEAKGIAFITTLRGGLVYTGTVGTGIVIAKLSNGEWSGPSSLGVAGMGWGLQIGASSTDSVIVLNTTAAVKAFSGSGQVKFGGNMSVAAGPVGRDGAVDVNVGDGGVAACYSYSHSRGAFAGISLQGSVLIARDKDNAKFYGQKVTPSAILTGLVKPPHDDDLELLYKSLNQILSPDTQYSSGLSGSLHDLNHESIRSSSAVFEDSDSGDETPLGPLVAEYSSNDQERYPVAQYATQSPAQSPTQSPTSAYFDDVKSTNKPPTPNQNNLPPGWQEVATPDGQVYYWNETQNVTQWERPVIVATAPPPPPPPPLAQPPHQASPTVAAVPFQASRDHDVIQTQQPHDLAFSSMPPQVENHLASTTKFTPKRSPPIRRASSKSSSSFLPTESSPSQQQPLSTGAGVGFTDELTGKLGELDLKNRSNRVDTSKGSSTSAGHVPDERVPPQIDATPTSKLMPPSIPPRPVSYQAPTSATTEGTHAGTVSTMAHQSTTDTTAPSPNSPQALEASYSLEQVRQRAVPNLDVTRLDAYLSASAFQEAFGMDRDTFSKLPKWKRDKLKREQGLF